MKKRKTVTWILLGYQMRKQLHGGYKVTKYLKLSDGSKGKKVTIAKNLSETDAEAMIYKLERK